MSGNNGFDALPSESYSQLLLFGDDQISGFSQNPAPKMLCFGDYQNPLKTISNKKNKPKYKHAKAPKKEKLGDRITALQQLVSPFGKTDTASVLHEAFGYIGFLQDQVHVLCSPYLQSCPSSSSQDPHHADLPTDLRSRGLCLVPMELTLHVPDSNGAHLWSSVAMLHP